ncbi:MAG: sulfatase-like hydrolase/transferase [Gammaproteobacteria bacterium]|nr:sulfatase-like hydrolase/transferase [Gammaproteobacteria bacterium]NKB65179.1 sulfatase-like hydrolase/transferase [Gammaproteobacteria bacterium]
MTRPNILLISADQHRADCFGFAGRNIKTPNLDELARGGTRFHNCITSNVVCQPSRASILTGQLCRTHGVHDNGIDLDPELGEKGFAGTLAKSGYETAFFGKAHFSTYHTFEPTGTPECVMSSANYDETWFGPYMGFNHVELMLVGHNWFLPNKPPHGQHFERWFYADGKGDEKNRLYNENAYPTQGAQTWHSKLPEKWHNTTWTADRTIDWLGKQGESPFCAWVSFPDPHHPFDAPLPWSTLHHPDEVDLPSHRERNFAGRPWWHEAVLTAEPTGDPVHAETRKAYSRIVPQTDEQLREIIANTYGMISLIDHHVGRIMKCLKDLQLDENTIVIFTSDHGDWLGDHGLILKGPMHYDGLLKIPMIVNGPGVKPDTVVSAPVSSMDLAATFADFANTEMDIKQHGTSLKPLLEDENAGRDFAFNEWELLPTRAGVALSLQTVRTETEKLTVDLRSGAGEMYDLKEDPFELHNIYDDPDAKDMRKRLEDMIKSRPDDMKSIQQQVGQA